MSSLKKSHNYLFKHTAAIHIQNAMTLVDRQVHNILIKNAFSNMLKQDMHTISIDNLLTELGHSGYKNYTFIKTSIKKLVSNSINFNLLGKDKKKKWESAITLLSSAHFTQGQVYYSFPKELAAALGNPNIYASLNLNYQKNLSSKYAIALWEYCTEQLDSTNQSKIQTEILNLEKLKQLLGATDKVYDEFKNLNRFVLKNAIAEVCNITDIDVDYKTIKTSRKVIGVTFEIVRKTISTSDQLSIFGDQTNIIDLIHETITEQEIYTKSRDLGIEDESIKKFLKEYSLDEVSKTIDVVLEKVRSQEKITNLVGYIWKILEKGAYKEVSSDTAYKNIKQKELFLLEKKKTTSSNKVMNDFLAQCKDHFGDAIFRSWIIMISYLSHDEKTVVFTAQSSFIKEWIEKNYSDQLLDIWRKFHPEAEKLIIQFKK
jgi:plasmid replication initiation protein